MPDGPEDLARGIAENVGLMPLVHKIGAIGAGANAMIGRGGTTLREIISTARNLLPDFAEGDYKVARGDITPAEHPAARIMDELKAKAKAEGKSEYAFLGRLLPIDRVATVEQIMSEFPRGEMEEAGGVGMAVAKDRMAAPFKALTREGLEEVATGSMVKNIAGKANIAATKSALAPKDELEALLRMRGPTKEIVQSYEGVLEREALKKMGRLKKAASMLGSKPARTAAGIASRIRGGDEEY